MLTNSEKNPLLSIIIPAYNSSAFIQKTLESIAFQLSSGLEVILIDDGSTDQTGETLKIWAQNNRNTRYIHQNNLGLAAARNTGIKHAKGKYITFLDSDDLLYEASLEERIKFLEEKDDENAACFCRFFYVDERGHNLLNHSFGVMNSISYTNSNDCSFPVHSVMLRRSALLKHGIFDESWKTAEDVDLWQRLARGGIVFYPVSTGSVAYRLHKNSMLSNGLVNHFKAFEKLNQNYSSEDPRVKYPNTKFKYGLEANLKPLLKRCLSYLIRLSLNKEKSEYLENRYKELSEEDQISEENHAEIISLAITRTLVTPQEKWLTKLEKYKNQLVPLYLNLGFSEEFISKTLSSLSKNSIIKNSDFTLLQEQWARFNKQYGTVAIFGCGRHTQALFKFLNERNVSIPKVECFIDEIPATSPITDVPVKTPDKVKIQKLDAIIISTNANTTFMKNKCQNLFGTKIKIDDPYNWKYLSSEEKVSC